MGTDHKAQLDRMSRIEGQVRGIRRMIEGERYCCDILLQLRSVINALSKVQDNIFRRHLESCVSDSLAGSDEGDKEKKIEEIIDLVARFSRQ
jgi:DNA-binding FrmR family transcriptional regulator